MGADKLAALSEKKLGGAVMATGFNTQVGGGEYRLQFETDNKEHYLLMQETARRCVDSANAAAKSKKSPCETCSVSTNPEGCQKKHCKMWKEWFMNRWEQIHNYGEKHKA